MAKEVEFVKCLGSGSFGYVNLVKVKEADGSSKCSAMKICNWWNYESLDREIQVLSKLRGCPRVVQSFGDVLEEVVTKDGRKIYRMFLEYAARGTLEDYMSKHIDRRLPDWIIRDITRMILESLASIHSRGYIHCDLKPENILVFPDGVKISDFGLSRETEEKTDWWKPESPFWATPVYMSPESVVEGKIGKALDLWSLGCVVLEMYTGEPPWLYEDEKEIMSALRNGGAPEIPETLPWIARQFLETCFARNPEERGNASDLLAHSFLRGYESRQPEKKIVDDRKPLISKIGVKSKPFKLKIIPPRPPKSRSIPRGPLRLKIIPPRPPASHVAVN